MCVQIAGKYDQEIAAKCMGWLADTLPDESIDASGSMDSVFSQLKDGYILCKSVVCLL